MEESHGFSLDYPAAGHALPTGVKADAVSDWSLIANNVVIVNAATRPPASMIDFAYVHIAIYDAVNAIDGRYSAFSATPSELSRRGVAGGRDRGCSLHDAEGFVSEGFVSGPASLSG